MLKMANVQGREKTNSYHSGKSNNPTFETLSKLADALKVSIDELAGRIGSKVKRRQ